MPQFPQYLLRNIQSIKSSNFLLGLPLSSQNIFSSPFPRWYQSAEGAYIASLHLRSGLSGQLKGKESACNPGDAGSIPGSGRCPGGGHSNPLQDSCLENPLNRGAWWTTVHSITKSQTQLKRLSTQAPRLFLFFLPGWFSWLLTAPNAFLYHST